MEAEAAGAHPVGAGRQDRVLSDQAYILYSLSVSKRQVSSHMQHTCVYAHLVTYAYAMQAHGKASGVNPDVVHRG